ncbi:hypothetical protein UA08_07375 [Talaromyces atroroseus]|uniref:2-methylcitrate dehydratase n=1 Tax=Talaromyces atroroseus TaxID=1441469 RepID=A0A225AA96_TALAT|nr:hypothetical protein UA08_07375 [Talaromyces atroroseus]OKL57050.1 hypothetical protein UA08_07375 [Talaromyces atroroseus]
MPTLLPAYDRILVDIKNYVFGYEATSERARSCARLAIFDALGCAIESVAKSTQCRSFIGPIVPGTTIPDGFRLPGTSYELDPVKGAFDLGALIRYLDHNDALAGADWGHPSDNLGALLAVMDWLSRAATSGRLVHRGPPLTIDTLITAVIKVYEIQGCLLLRNAFNAVGLDHTILVKLASTAVVSWLLGLSEDQTLAAISHAWMDLAPLRVYRSGSNTIPRKGWAAGDACMRAVQFALLTRTGQPGAPTPLTMPRWGFYASIWRNGAPFTLPKPYTTWVVENVFFKVMPVEGHGIAAVQAAVVQAQRMLHRGLLDPVKDIHRIEIRTCAAAHLIIDKNGPLHNAADRDHCMQYCVAVALLKGAAPEAGDFQDGSLYASSQAVEDLRAKIKIRPDESLTADYLDLDKKSIPSALAIHLTNGDVLEEVLVEFPLGHVRNPGTHAAVVHKYRQNLALLFSRSEIEEIEKIVNSGGDRNVSDLLDLLVRYSYTKL